MLRIFLVFVLVIFIQNPANALSMSKKCITNYRSIEENYIAASYVAYGEYKRDKNNNLIEFTPEEIFKNKGNLLKQGQKIFFPNRSYVRTDEHAKKILYFNKAKEENFSFDVFCNPSHDEVGFYIEKQKDGFLKDEQFNANIYSSLVVAKVESSFVSELPEEEVLFGENAITHKFKIEDIYVNRTPNLNVGDEFVYFDVCNYGFQIGHRYLILIWNMHMKSIEKYGLVNIANGCTRYDISYADFDEIDILRNLREIREENGDN